MFGFTSDHKNIVLTSLLVSIYSAVRMVNTTLTPTWLSCKTPATLNLSHLTLSTQLHLYNHCLYVWNRISENDDQEQQNYLYSFLTKIFTNLCFPTRHLNLTSSDGRLVRLWYYI